MSEDELAQVRADMTRRGMQLDGMSDGDIQQLMKTMAQAFRDNAPLSAAQAATVILDGVRAGQWRILVGDDARAIDAAVRGDPENAYAAGGPGFPTINRGSTEAVR